VKIGVYDPYLDDLGGGEKYMMTLASCLAKRHTVSVFWNNKKDIEDIQERFAIDFSDINVVKNIFTAKTNFFKRAAALAKYDRVIYLSDGSLPFVIKKNLFVHIQQPLEQINTLFLKDKWKLRNVLAFFCNSEYTKSFIEKKIGKRVFILYPPIILSPKNIKKENSILHVGRFRTKNIEIDDYKKQFFMVEVFKEMIDRGLKNWHFSLAVSLKDDDKEAFAKIQELAKNYPIKFFINKTNQELWDLYSKAKIYWHASGYGENLEKFPENAEHFGISTVEAMGAGAVPVVINAGGQKEIVTRDSGLVWNTKEELVKKTLQLIKDEALLLNMSKNAVKRANFFAGNKFCKEVEQLIL